MIRIEVMTLEVEVIVKLIKGKIQTLRKDSAMRSHKTEIGKRIIDANTGQISGLNLALGLIGRVTD